MIYDIARIKVEWLYTEAMVSLEEIETSATKHREADTLSSTDKLRRYVESMESDFFSGNEPWTKQKDILRIRQKPHLLGKAIWNS